MNQDLKDWLSWGDLRARINGIYMLLYGSVFVASIWLSFARGQEGFGMNHLVVIFGVLIAMFLFQCLANLTCLIGRMENSPTSLSDEDIRNAADSRAWLRKEIQRVERLSQ